MAEWLGQVLTGQFQDHLFPRENEISDLGRVCARCVTIHCSHNMCPIVLSNSNISTALYPARHTRALMCEPGFMCLCGVQHLFLLHTAQSGIATPSQSGSHRHALKAACACSDKLGHEQARTSRSRLDPKICLPVCESPHESAHQPLPLLALLLHELHCKNLKCMICVWLGTAAERSAKRPHAMNN